MSVNKRNMPRYGSDFAKVDAYENTAADYLEIPDLAERDLSEGQLRENGVPVKRPRGRPSIGDTPKAHVTLRLDQDIVDHFKNEGSGWQGRINQTLRQVVGERMPQTQKRRDPA